MKPSHALGLVVAAVGLTVAVEEYRIANLRAELAERPVARVTEAGRPTGPASAPLTADAAPDPSAVRARERPEPEPAAAEPAEEADDMARTIRKMWENPAGKSMMNQGVKMAVEMMWGDYIESLDLTKEEADYFRELLGRDIAMQQELGMKMLGASEEEREELVAEMERRQKENEAAVETFLNSDEDHQRFSAYKERLPERQQLEGLRAAFGGKDLALDAPTEERLVEAMHRARTASGAQNLEGVEGLRALAEGNMTDVFERSWQAQQAALRREVQDVLDEPRREAFFEYQEQMKEMQLMGIKMAEKMFAPSEEK